MRSGSLGTYCCVYGKPSEASGTDVFQTAGGRYEGTDGGPHAPSPAWELREGLRVGTWADDVELKQHDDSLVYPGRIPWDARC